MFLSMLVFLFWFSPPKHACVDDDQIRILLPFFFALALYFFVFVYFVCLSGTHPRTRTCVGVCMGEERQILCTKRAKHHDNARNTKSHDSHTCNEREADLESGEGVEGGMTACARHIIAVLSRTRTPLMRASYRLLWLLLCLSLRSRQRARCAS